MYHSFLYTNKQVRRLLKAFNIKPWQVNLAEVRGKPAKTKNYISLSGNKITIFGSDFVAKGYIKQR